MKITSFKKYAMTSAVALSLAFLCSSANAQVQILAGEDVDVDATVENTITVAVTDMEFGTIGAVKHDTTTATITLAPDGTVTDDPGQGYGSARPASIVYDTTIDGAVAGELDISGAIAGADIFVTYSDFVDPVNGADSFVLTDVTDDCTSPGLSAAGVLPVVAPDTICQATTVAGAVTIALGAGLTTEVASGPTAAFGEAYPDGVYTGGFTAYISY